MDIKILSTFLKDRDVWDRYTGTMGSLAKEEPEYKVCFDAVDRYYETYPDHSYISTDEFNTYLHHEFLKDDDQPIYKTIVDRLDAVDTSSSLIENIIKDRIGVDIANSLSQDLLPVLDGQKKFEVDRVKTLVERYETKVNREVEEVGYVPSAEELLHVAVRRDGWTWPVEFLNKNLGALNGGRLGHVFAYVSTGKTSFGANCVAHWLREGAKVHYYNNEEKGSKVFLRVLLSYFGITNAQYAENIYKYYDQFMEEVGENFDLIDDALLTVSKIEKLVQDKKPNIILIDIADKVAFRGGHTMTEVLRIQNLYVKYRNLAKTYPIDIITLGQGDGNTASRKILKKEHMNYSKVGKPGELDFALGIGKVEQDTDDFMRWLSVCKNKDGEEGWSTAILDPQRAIYKDGY